MEIGVNLKGNGCTRYPLQIRISGEGEGFNVIITGVRGPDFSHFTNFPVIIYQSTDEKMSISD